MKKSRFTETQIVKAIQSHEAGRKVEDLCREMEISTATFYKWKQRYGGMEASEVKKLRELQEENSRLKRMYAELALENTPEQFPPTPTGIVSVRIDRKTGLLTQASDDSSEFEYFMQGTEPTQYADPVNPLQPDQQKPAEIDIFR